MILNWPFKKRHPATLNPIEAAEFSLIYAHWKGSPCIVKVRELTDIQIQACGNFSLIETEKYKWSKAQTKMQWSELLAYANQNVKIIRASLVSPTYDEIFDIVGKGEFNAQVKKQVENINSMLQEMPEGPARQELEAVRDSLIMAWDIILPEDFIADIVPYAVGMISTQDGKTITKSDIKKVTEEMLYNAAILADRGHKAPHEYLHGAFSEFNERDIDTRAWVIYNEKIEEYRQSRGK